MYLSSPDDVPSPIDLRRMEDAREWVEAAMIRRPYRNEVFRRMVGELKALEAPEPALLELGSGPGFLAARVLEALPGASYLAADFSPAMHALARERLGPLARRVRFLEADFRDSSWSGGFDAFDAVLSVQAIHELRHKRHAPVLYGQVRRILAPGGDFLMCDHVVDEGGMSNRSLFMTLDEQDSALRAGGFEDVDLLLCEQGLALFRASVA